MNPSESERYDAVNAIRTAHHTAEHVAERLMETRTGESTIRPTFASEHPPCVPDAIADRTPVAATRYHIVLPQGYDWENTNPNATWYAYDKKIHAFNHPRTPDESTWWTIIVRKFDSEKWLHDGASCVARSAEHAGEILHAYLTGDDTAIADARDTLPDHATESRKSATSTARTKEHPESPRLTDW